jgi:DNA repair exonuclease SbcCD nuclease subunit
MKIGIASDFHLGFNDDALSQAREALFKAARECDFVLLPGDLFDYRVPRQEVVNEACKMFSEAKKILEGKCSATIAGAQCSPVVVIYGTHERRSKGLANIIHVLDSANLVSNCHAKTVLVEKNGEKVSVQGLGGVPEEKAAESLEYLAQKPVKDANFNLFVFHQSLSELMPLEDCMSMNDLPQGFDLYVNGHIHWRRELNEDGKRLLIPGSTVVTQMKKSEVEPKGYYVLDTQTSEAEFKAINSRKFFFEELDFKDVEPSTVLQTARKKLGELSSVGGKPLVKLKLKGTLAKGFRKKDVNEASALEREFSEKCFASVDNELESQESAGRIALSRKAREEGVKGSALEILKKRLSESGWKLGGEEELLELLEEGELDLASEKIRTSKTP